MTTELEKRLDKSDSACMLIGYAFASLTKALSSLEDPKLSFSHTTNELRIDIDYLKDKINKLFYNVEDIK